MPSEAIKLTDKASRARFVAALAKAVAALDIGAQVDHRPGADLDSVTITHARLSASIAIFHHGRAAGDRVPLISWHSADAPLAYVSAAWSSVNQYHRRKATSFPVTLDQLQAMLVAGLKAADSGEAFR